MEFDHEKQIRELKSELEGKEDSFHFAITALQTELEGRCNELHELKIKNQSLHDQITEMEAERIRIYQFAAKAKVAISNIQAT